jgi:hypothetical protein
MKSMSGCPVNRFRGKEWPSVIVAGRSLNKTCLYDAGRLKVVDILFEGSGSTTGVGGRFLKDVGGGFVEGCVCWRHTTIFDGTWACCLVAADLNVRTLGWARCGAPYLLRAIL